MASDFELLDAWRGGDLAAGDRLFRRHFDDLCRFFRNKVGDGVDDLIQKTFLALIEKRDQFRKQASFRTYIFVVARHELYRYLRRRKRDSDRFDPLEMSVRDVGESPTAAMAKKREERLLLEALRSIPLDHQIALELFYWQEMTAGELAEVLDIPEGTVRSRLRRGRQLLEERLAELADSGEQLETTLANLEQWARSLRRFVGPDPGGT